MNKEKFEHDLAELVRTDQTWLGVVAYNNEVYRVALASIPVPVSNKPSESGKGTPGFSFGGINIGLGAAIGGSILIIGLIVAGVIFIPKIVKGGRP